MEALFKNQSGAPVAIIGQSDVDARRLDKPTIVPNMLSFLACCRYKAELHGLPEFPKGQVP